MRTTGVIEQDIVLECGQNESESEKHFNPKIRLYDVGMCLHFFSYVCECYACL